MLRFSVATVHNSEYITVNRKYGCVSEHGIQNNTIESM